MASIIIDHLDEEELADLRAIIADAIELQNDHSTIVWLALSQVELFLQKLQQQFGIPQHHGVAREGDAVLKGGTE